MDFFDFLPLWGWFILCATVVGLVVVPAGIKKDRVRAVKRDKEDWERRVRKDLKENGYEITAYMKFDRGTETLTVRSEQTWFQLELEERSISTWLYVEDERGQRHIVQPDDFRRYVEESRNWLRRVRREAGFTD